MLLQPREVFRNFRSDEMFRYRKSWAQNVTQKQWKLIKMNKRKVKIMLEILSNVATAYPETVEYNENTMMELCSRELFYRT